MAKVDAAGHWWVAILDYYNLMLYYRAGKANSDADTLSRVPWPGNVTNAMETMHWVIATAVWALQEASLKGLMNPIEVYSCDLLTMVPVENSQQVSCMTTKDWWQAQLGNPVVRGMIMKIQDGTLGQHPFKSTDPVELKQLPREYNHLKLWKGILYQKVLPRDSQEELLQLVLLN